MKAIRAIVLLTIRDGIRGRAWFPFLFALILCSLALVFGFGLNNIVSGRLPADPRYLYRIVSLVFFLWTWGTLFTVLSVGSTSFPRERRTPMLFTLPISRWEIAVGKLIGAEILTGAFLAVGYTVCAGLAKWSHVPIRAYSGLGFATALTISFVYLCLSVPLGAWLSPIVVATLTLFAEAQASIFDVLTAMHLMKEGSIVPVVMTHLMPWRIGGEPIRSAFVVGMPASLGDYTELILNGLIAAVFFIGLTFLMRRDELRLKETS